MREYGECGGGLSEARDGRFSEREYYMKELKLSDIINKKEKRNAYNAVLDFIESDRCYDGEVCIIFGLYRTGKTTIMQQIMAENADRYSFMFLEPESEDTMENVYAYLDEAVKKKARGVFIDEITKVSDFIENSAYLADIYAKEGLRIVLSGDDSLSFVFAQKSSLFGRTETVSTTYISFEEHCRVLGTEDIDDYISYGGVMVRFISDYDSACRYLDKAVSGNISRSLRSLAKYSNHTELFDVSEDEMKAVVEKMVERYCNTSPSVKELADEINADTKIVHKFTEDMIARLENALIDIGFVSAIKCQEIDYSESFGRKSLPVGREYYITQPAIKYYHMKKASEKEKPDIKIKEVMVKQAVVFEISCALPPEKYSVYKISFRDADLDKIQGGYDMLIYDKTANSYYAFEITLAAEANDEQYRHLTNEKFREIIDYKYGGRETICVLYSGKPCKTSDGVLYLNISGFVREVSKCRDIKEAMGKLAEKAVVGA